MTINKKALYLFFIKENTTHSDIKGHMPFNRQFGFIYAANQSITELTRAMAHELGHGAFRLKHTFSDENSFVQDQGQTPNIMDYASGSELLKYQWDECHDFDLGCNWFEDGDEAESASLCMKFTYAALKNQKLITIYSKMLKTAMGNEALNYIKNNSNNLIVYVHVCSFKKATEILGGYFRYSTASAFTYQFTHDQIQYYGDGKRVPYDIVEKLKAANVNYDKSIDYSINKKKVYDALGGDGYGNAGVLYSLDLSEACKSKKDVAIVVINSDDLNIDMNLDKNPNIACSIETFYHEIKAHIMLSSDNGFFGYGHLLDEHGLYFGENSYYSPACGMDSEEDTYRQKFREQIIKYLQDEK